MQCCLLKQQKTLPPIVRAVSNIVRCRPALAPDWPGETASEGAFSPERANRRTHFFPVFSRGTNSTPSCVRQPSLFWKREYLSAFTGLARAICGSSEACFVSASGKSNGKRCESGQRWCAVGQSHSPAEAHPAA